MHKTNMLKKATIYSLIISMLIGLVWGSNTYARTKEEADNTVSMTTKENNKTKNDTVKDNTVISTESNTETTTECIPETTADTITVSATENKKETVATAPKEENVKTSASSEKTTQKMVPDYTVKDIEKKTMYATMSLNIRKGPGTSYESVGSIRKNQAVTVNGAVNDSHWVRVEYNGKAGYASGKYLSDKKIEVSSATTESANNTTAMSTETSEETVKAPVTQSKEETFTVKDIEKKTMYATTSLNVRTGPSTSYGSLGSLSNAEAVTVNGTVNDSHWVRVEYKGKTGYASGKYLADKKPAVSSGTSSTVKGYPITYSDSSCKITITKEWFENAYVYAAHITFSDYSRFGTTCGKGSYGGKETTTSAAKRVGALLAVNGCYSAPYLNYPVARSGKVMNNKNCWVPAVYSRWNGKLLSAWETGGTQGIAGVNLSTLVSENKVSDTFSFGPPILAGGSIKAGSDSSRAQRTFIGTNGNAGDIWLFVSDGRYNDGKSAGLTYKQCARYMQSKGCNFGVPLDGGGSSTMVWKGNVLNAAKGNQRSVVDFVYFK